MAGSGIILDTRRKLQVLALNMTSKELMNKVYSKKVLGYAPDLSSPKTFNEKLQWLKMYYYPKQEKCIELTDKLQVKSFLKKNGYGDYLPQLYGQWNDPSEIDWDSLPEQFVIKCNHGCAYNIVCKSKKQFDRNKAEKSLKKWIKEDFGKFYIELHYSKIKKAIFAEEYLGDKLVDYKFFCFNGKPKFLYVSQDLIHDSIAKMAYYDLEFNKLPLVRAGYEDIGDIDKPSKFKEMIELSENLSKEFPFVRIDLYQINDKILFSEFTFTPHAGMMRIDPKKYDDDWGSLLKIDFLLNSQNV